MDAKTSLVLTFLCLSSFQCLNLVNGDEALIERLCDATSIPPLCTHCVKSDPSSGSASDIGITEICMACAGKDMDQLFEDTFRYQGNTSEQILKDALGFCLDQFEDSKTKINGVSDKVQSRDFNTAKGIIKDQILAQVNSCTDHIISKGFQVPWVVSNGIATVVRDWDIVLGILSVLK